MDVRTMGGALALVGAMGMAGCSESEPTAPAAAAEVAIAFGAVTSTSGGVTSSQQAGSIVLSGTNGDLRINALHVIVDRFELKRADDDRCAEEDHACERVSTPPLLAELALGGSSTVAVRQPVEPDTYRRLRFEIDDLDDDEENAARAEQIRLLRQAIRARFPDWPRQASLLATGSFTPAGGSPIPFRTYLEARIRVEERLVPPVTVTAGPMVPPVTVTAGPNGGTFTVELDLAVLFGAGGGAVRDLAALDFDRTGRVPELRIDLEDGASRIRFRR